jgi:hypothetical protein
MLRRLSIKTRFFLLLAGSVIYWLIAGFVALSLIDSLAEHRGIEEKISALPLKILNMENSVGRFYNSDLRSVAFHESGSSEGLSRFNRGFTEARTLLIELREQPGISGNPIIRQKIDRLYESLSESDALIAKIVDESRQRGWGEYGLSGIVSEQIRKRMRRNGAICSEWPGSIWPILKVYSSIPC